MASTSKQLSLRGKIRALDSDGIRAHSLNTDMAFCVNSDSFEEAILDLILYTTKASTARLFTYGNGRQTYKLANDVIIIYMVKGQQT